MFRAAFGKGLMGGLGLLVGWVPALLILTFAALYLWECFAYLLAPGVGLTYAFRGQAGVSVVSLDSYAINLSERSARLYGFSLVAPDGEEVASAPYIHASYEHGVIGFRAPEAEARIERDALGQFNIAKLFPEEDREPSAQKLTVEIGKLQVLYIDKSGREPIVEEILLTDAKYAQSGSSAMAGSMVSVRGDRSFPLSLSYSDEAFRIHGEFDGHELAPVIEILAMLEPFEFPDALRPFGAESLMGYGEVSVSYRPDAGAYLAGAMRAVGRGVRLGETIQNGALEITLDGDLNGIDVTGQLREPGRSARIDGRAEFGDNLRLVGDLYAQVDSLDRLWPQLREAVAGFDLAARSPSFDGAIVYRDDALYLNGVLAAPSVNYLDFAFEDVRGTVALSPERLVTEVEQAAWNDREVRAAFTVALPSKQITGLAELARGDLGFLAERFEIEGLDGVGRVEAVASGSIAEPLVALFAEGEAVYALDSGQTIDASEFQLRADITDEGLVVERFRAVGAQGVAVASGAFDWSTGAVDLTFDIDSVSLAEVSPDLSGVVFVDGLITGQIDDPIVTGRAWGYGITAFERIIPQAVVAFEVDAEGAQFSEVNAQLGVGSLEGSLAVDFGSGALSGDLVANDLALSDWISPKVAGLFSLDVVTVGGTTEDPIATVEAQATDVALFGVPVESVSVRARLTPERAEILTARADIGTGSVTADGHYSFAENAGMVTANFSELPLDLVPVGERVLSLGGTASGTATAEFADAELLAASLDAGVNDVVVNGTILGSGSLQADTDGEIVTASGSVGSLERYIALDDATYNVVADTYNATATVFNLSLANLTAAADQIVSELGPNLQRALVTAEGDVSAVFEVEGTSDDWEGVAEALTITGLELYSRDAGSIGGSVAQQGGVWTIQGASWTADQVDVRADATITGEGAIAGDLEVSKFDLTWIPLAFPSAPLIGGKLTASANFAGTIEEPYVQASATFGNLSVRGEDAIYDVPVQVDLYDLTLSDDVVAASGQAFYRGFTGEIDALIPLSALSQGENREPLTATLTLAERSVSDLARDIPGLDAEGSSGTFAGQLGITGALGSFDLTGGATAQGESLAFNGVQTKLRDYLIDMSLHDDLVTLRATAESSDGGAISATATADLPRIDAQSNLASLASETELDGAAVLESFGLAQALLNADELTSASVTGTVTLDGTVQRPVLDGELYLVDAIISVPSEFPEGAGANPLPINVIFDGIEVYVSEGTTLDTAAGRIDLSGQGLIAGTLEQPSVTATLDVHGGVFRLPNARIQLEDQGRINLSYQGRLGGQPLTQILIDLQGTTTLAARSGDDFETYNIDLLLRGDLARENGLQIIAFSDPPDLTQAEILAILGQRDLIESIARSALGGVGDLPSTLIAAALPSFTSELTEELASSLSLDYITLSYNPFYGAVISAGKALTDDLLLQLRRQVTEPRFGPLRYEIRLTYRPPFLDQFSGRYRLALSTDEQATWKISLEWSRRF